jgi:hypothetical protein
VARPDPPPDPWDRPLSALHTAVDNLGPRLAIWQARREPDAHARRCASDAIDAIDNGLAALHRIRAELVTETRQADDQAAARADQLLAKMRDGPSVPSGPRDRRQRTTTASPRPEASVEVILRPGTGQGRAPGEATR